MLLNLLQARLSKVKKRNAMVASIASTNRATHLTADTRTLHGVGQTAEECRTIRTVHGTVADPRPDLSEVLARSEWVAAATRSLLAESNRVVGEKGRLAAEMENRNLRTFLIAAEASEARFRAVLEAAPDAIVIADRDGRISLVNRRTEVMFGIDRAELLGQSVDALLPECYSTVLAAHRRHYAALLPAYAGGTAREIVGQHRDGSKFPVEVALSRIQRHSAMHIVATIRDITEHKRIEDALKESERFVHSTFDALPEHICVLDETGTIVAVNKAWREFAVANGADPRRTDEGVNYLAVCEEATGEYAHEARAFATSLRAVMRGEHGECEFEYPCQSNAAQEWYLCRATRFREGGPARFVVVHENITELKRAELALRAANEAAEAATRQEAERRHEAERRRQIAESLRDVMSILNSERPLADVLEYIASQANRLFGSQAAAVYQSGHETEAVLTQMQQGSARGMVIENHIVVDREALKQTVQLRGAFAISDVPSALTDVAGQAPTNASAAFKIPVPADCSALLAVPILIKDAVYGGLVLYDSAPRLFTREEVELASMFADQAALAIDNARLKQQATDAAAAQERNRLARDLHDAVTQVIFSANLMAEALPLVWERDPDEGKRGLEQLRLLTRGALAEMRTLLFELRPAALLDKPLPDLLRQLTEAMVTRSQASITFEAEGTCALPPATHVVIYRIAQEALNNATKHAAARTIKVVLRCSPRRLVLRVRDDGRGFEANAVTSDHFGIAIMQERARPIGARCSIHSRPGEGTQVTVIWSAAATACIDRPQPAIEDSTVTRRPAARKRN